ncbi:hypothetical protein JNUCC64_03515 [Streptomyces sp. JNUCC 64]
MSPPSTARRESGGQRPGRQEPERQPSRRRDPTAYSQVLLGEYTALKAEQSARIAARDNLMYATLAALVLTATAVAGTAGHRELVLLLPPVCLVLGWTYLVNDEKVSAIGGYLRAELTPRLAVASGADPGDVLGWETAHRAQPRRTTGKYLQLAVDLVMFVAPALTALAVFWATGPGDPVLLAVSAAELAAVAVLATRVVVSADLRGNLASEGTVQ